MEYIFLDVFKILFTMVRYYQRDTQFKCLVDSICLMAIGERAGDRIIRPLIISKLI